jgi:hypothetical protein
LRILGIWTAAITLVGAIAYGELVGDWRIRRSEQSVRFTAGVTHGASIAEFNSLSAAMKQKYGARTDTTLHINTGIAEVTLDGKLLETHSELKRISSVYGVFVFGPDEDITMRFPFEVSADLVQANSNEWIADRLRKNFRKSPAVWFEFKDTDWSFDRCIARPKDLGLGIIGKALFLRGGTYCVVSWKGEQPSTMLINVSVADGNPWMRPFVRRVCRAITEAALSRFDPELPDSPKYAACVLIDRPEYGSARKSLAVDVYSVGGSNKLRRMEFDIRKANFGLVSTFLGARESKIGVD